MRPPPSVARALALGLLLAGTCLARRDHTLVIVDSRGQPAGDLVEEARRLARHRRARVTVRWIRIGHPWPLAPTVADAPAPEEGEPPPEPEWDPDGSLTAGFELEGLPRLLVLDPEGHVLWREAFLDTGTLRYLSRHPDRPPPSPPAP